MCVGETPSPVVGEENGGRGTVLPEGERDRGKVWLSLSSISQVAPSVTAPSLSSRRVLFSRALPEVTSTVISQAEQAGHQGIRSNPTSTKRTCESPCPVSQTHCGPYFLKMKLCVQVSVWMCKLFSWSFQINSTNVKMLRANIHNCSQTCAHAASGGGKQTYQFKSMPFTAGTFLMHRKWWNL